MQRYRHPDGDDAPKWVGVRGTFRAETDDNGEFDADVDADTMREYGFEVVGSDTAGPEEGPDYTKIPPELEDMTHGELKAVAEDLGIAGDIDLRSKSSIREGINAHQEG